MAVNQIKSFVKVATWADVIRKTYFDGGVDEIISTRRLYTLSSLCNLCKKMKFFVEVCTNRFDNDTKNSFIELYTKVDVLRATAGRLQNTKTK